MEEKSEEIQIEHLDGKVRRMVGRSSGSGGWRPQQRNRVCCPTGRISDRSDCSAVPDGYPKEAVKAQAILARTALYREMDGADSIEESA